MAQPRRDRGRNCVLDNGKNIDRYWGQFGFNFYVTCDPRLEFLVDRRNEGAPSLGLDDFGYSHWPEVLSNGELCKDAKTFAQRMRDFHHERQLQKDTVEKDYRGKNEIARIESEKEQLWREYRALDDRWHNDYSYDYENKLRPVAISLRDQLLARLPSLLPQTADSQLMDDASFYNVGAFGTPRAADRLEAYARMLCPTPTSK